MSGQRWASGTLISADLFLTAGHNFDQDADFPRDNATGNVISPAEIATNMHVNFDFQFDPSGNPRPEQRFAITQLIEYRLGGLDFAVVRLAGNPGATFGTSGMSSTDAAVGDMACIIGHPLGMPKRIEAGPVTELTGTRILYNDIDTLGGNSGSGISARTTARSSGSTPMEAATAQAPAATLEYESARSSSNRTLSEVSSSRAPGQRPPSSTAARATGSHGGPAGRAAGRVRSASTTAIRTPRRCLLLLPWSRTGGATGSRSSSEAKATACTGRPTTADAGIVMRRSRAAAS